MSSGEPPRPLAHCDYKDKGIAHTKKRKYLLREMDATTLKSN